MAAKNITQFPGVPEEYLPMFKAGISTINASMYFEETIRNQVGLIRLTPRHVKVENDVLKLVNVSDYLINKGKRAISEIKVFNKVVNQVFINPNGVDQINELGYTLGNIFDEISYLSVHDQERVAQFVMGLKKEYEAGFKVELNKK